MISIFHHHKTDQKSSTNREIVKIIPLGGVGNVTKNMYVYEYHKNNQLVDLIIVDCGVGFPDEAMYGVDLVIPDISYLQNKKDKIRGLILTHGHEDHIGALPYILPRLNTPVYGTKLTIALAEVKLKEFGLTQKIFEVKTTDQLKFGAFTVELVHVTHSIPDATNLIIHTPVGIFYHGSDYKFDWTPIDGKPTEVTKIAQAQAKGILCLLSDCVRAEAAGYTLSEQVIEDTLEKEIRNCQGKFIFTTQSSNISRIQQAINVALRNNRRIAFLGRSIEQNVEVARKLKYLDFPDIALIKEKEIKHHHPPELCLIVTGCQAQPRSALSRIAEKMHQTVSITPKDVVVFSADPIPGYENAVHNLIDTLAAQGAKVTYSDIIDELHVSGHGSINDLSLMIGLTKPKFIFPIGGTIRQMHQLANLAEKMGYQRKQIILPEEGDVLEFDGVNVATTAQIDLKNIMVDGLGVGDVGNIVLRDRQTMASEGMVVVVVPVEQKSGKVTAEPDIISRGFVYMRRSTQLIEQAKKVVVNSLRLKKGKILEWQFVRKQIEDNLENFFYRETRRRPLIVAVVIEV